MKATEILNYLSDTMKWANDNGINYKDVIEEIATAGFTNAEVGFMIKEISLNNTFKINNK